MTPQLRRALNKLYKYQNSDYDGERAVSVYSTDTLTEKERALLAEHGWQPNEIVYFAGHDDVLQKLKSLQGHPALSRQHCLAAFVAGLGGSWPRGCAALGAWLHLNALEPHAYHEKPRFKCCWVCSGHNEPEYENDSYFQYCLYLGNAYTGNPQYAYLNLRHLTQVATVAPTDADVAVFRNLVALLREAPPTETPGQFEKRLAAAKIVKGDKYTKRGLLDSLARAGVIPNQFMELSPHVWSNFGDVAVCEDRLSNTKGRSDMEMPWAGWLGELKLNEERLAELFSEYL